MISLIHEESGAFSEAIPSALREYADAVEFGNDFPASFGKTPESTPPACGKSALERLKTTSGCEILVIAGSYYTGGDQSSKTMPLPSTSDLTDRIVEISK